MAWSKSTFLKNFSGKIGKEFVVKQYGDTTVISAYPNMKNRKLSVKQIKNNDLMKLANIRARTIIADPKQRDEHLLRLNVTRNKLYTALIRDFFQAEKAEQQQT